MNEKEFSNKMLKQMIGKPKWISSFHSWFNVKYAEFLTRISPRLNTQYHYRKTFKKPFDIDHPVSLEDKILKLKLEKYGTDELVRQCADKYRVREYVHSKGLSHILVPLIASYDKVDDIEWNKLPNEFAMKWNFGCGFNIICPDKVELDVKAASKKMKMWQKVNYYLKYSELQYKDVQKKILIEEFLKPENGLLPSDYKFYCFHGKPLAILYITDRGTSDKTAFFFDIDWNFISQPARGVYKRTDVLPEKPRTLSDMVDIAKSLSNPFDFVRVDLYEVNDKVYFGELTFTPAGGLHTSKCEINGKQMAEYL